MTEPSAKKPEMEEAAHLSLQLGRLLLANGADTAHVQTSVESFAAGLGYEARLLVSYEALLLTIISGGEFRTKISRHIAGMTVDMSAVRALNDIAEETAHGQLDADAARQRLAAVEESRALYPGWLVAIALGLTAACLSWLFGGNWPVFITSFVAGSLAIMVQHQFRHWRVHPLAVTFLTATVGGCIGGLGMRWHPGNVPALCPISSGMILVPGVPLINGIRDAISNNMVLSLVRLAWGLLVVTAIAFGLFTATMLTGVEIPIFGSFPLLPVVQDALFSALATIGYVFLFNVNWRIAWACVICGLFGHSLRTAMMHLGLDVFAATVVGSLGAGIWAYVFARHFRAPAAAFAFPGVVAMVPGSYAFRAIIAGLQIVHSPDNVQAALPAQEMSLVISTILLTAAIAIGLAIPLSFRLARPVRK